MSVSLGELTATFAQLSLLAFGGGNAILPEMHRLLVVQDQWLNETTFAQLFALAQAAPGPNILVVSLVGLHLCGVSGFLLATTAFCLPSSLGIYFFSYWWEKHRATHWHDRIQKIPGPLAAGLVLSGGWLMTQAATALSMPFLVLAIFVIFASLALRQAHPLWWIVCGAVFGATGGL